MLLGRLWRHSPIFFTKNCFVSVDASPSSVRCPYSHSLSSCSILFLSIHPIRSSVHYPSRQSLRYYRTRCEKSHLTLKQQFIQKVLQTKGDETVDSCSIENLQAFESKLSLLVSHGCKAYELPEYPQILSYDVDTLTVMIERLKSLGQTDVSMRDVSIPLLKFVKSSNSQSVAKAGIKNYIKRSRGRLNNLGAIADVLCCSGDEMIEIWMKNPRIGGLKTPTNFLEKVNCLLRYGARIDDIKANTHLLSNISLSVIETRAKKLTALGFDKPLRIGVLGRSENDFETIVKRLKDSPETAHFQESVDIIRQLPNHGKRSFQSVRTFKPKVDLLLAAGYTPAEILAHPALLMMSLRRISSAITYLQKYHMGIVSLTRCSAYAAHGTLASRNRRPDMKKLFARMLNCSSDDMPNLPKDSKLLTTDAVVIQKNVAFLTGIGFTIGSIRRMPLVLAHDPEALRLHWNRLLCHETLSEYLKRWGADDVKQLNLLQYFIEKETNFRPVGSTSDINLTLLQSSCQPLLEN